MKEKIKNHKFKEVIVPLVIFFILVFVAYVNVFNAPFLIDDKAAILKNPLIGSIDSIYKYPLSFLRQTLLFISYHIGHFTPFAYRIFNILFHFGTVVSLYLFIKSIFNKKFAFITAVLFAVHPMLTESVTWISAVPYPQYSFFFIFSLYSYVKGKKSKNWYIVSIVSSLFSILSSEKAVVLPVILALVEFTFFSLKDNWKKLLPHFIIVFLISFMIVFGLGPRIESFEKDYFIQREFYNPVEHVPYAVTYYLQLILFPMDLTVYHSELSISIWEFLIRWLFFIIIIVVTVASFSKQKPLFFWLLFYMIALSPTLIPVNVVWVVAERYAYLGTAGALAVFGYIIYLISLKIKNETIKYALFSFLILLLLGRTIIRNVDWQTEDGLWISTVKASPSSASAHNNMGDVYARRKDYQNAIIEFRRAIELRPSSPDAYHNLAISYSLTGQYQLATEYELKALELNPRLWQAHQNLGVIYHSAKMYPQAVFHLKKALELGPKNPVLIKILESIPSNDTGN